MLMAPPTRSSGFPVVLAASVAQHISTRVFGPDGKPTRSLAQRFPVESVTVAVPACTAIEASSGFPAVDEILGVEIVGGGPAPAL